MRAAVRLVALFLLIATGSSAGSSAVAGAPALMMYPSGRGAFSTRGGVELPLRAWRPDGPVQAVILALHGFNDYSNAFSRPAEAMAARGIQTYAYDQRGFGQGPDAGIWAGTDALVADARDAARLISARHPGRPLYLLGESMGGAVALLACGSAGAAPPVAGLVLSAPAVWSRGTMPPVYRGILEAMNAAVPWYPLTGEGLRRQASDNIEMLRELGRDPFVLKRTRIDAIHGLAGLMDAAARADIRLPVLLLYGLHDQIIPSKSLLATAERLFPAGDGKHRLAVYDGGYHLLLRDIAGDRVTADIAAWISDPGAALPSGADRTALTRLRARVEGRPAKAKPESFAPE